MPFHRRALCLAVTAALLWQPLAQADQNEVDALLKRVAILEQKLEATAAAVDEAKPAASRTHIGGYGELHYNNLDSKNEIDFHRFVLFFGHQFSDKIRLFSELELEHSIASKSAKGEVELEQAYIDLQLTQNHNLRTGLFLMPVGILNETHEPTTFYGVERNNVEKDIIPTTWWEGGAALNGRLSPGLSYDVAVTSGLKTASSGSDAYDLRKGRQKVSEAAANDLAYTTRLRWTGLPGVEIAGTLQRQDDITQGDNVAATLGEVHAVIKRGPVGMRALYAQWNLDNTAPKGPDKQLGWYVEPSYLITEKLGAFVRYSLWDKKAGDSAKSEMRQTDFGINYWAHPNVVYKADIQHKYDQSKGTSDDGFNLGVGYHF